MFDHFHSMFLMVFSANLLIYVAPICIKFRHDPLYATFLLQGIIATFKPYPTLSDPGLFVSTISIFPETFTYLRHPLPTVLLHFHSALLLPMFNHLWLNQGSGNANFFYASTLVFGLANGAAITDSLWAGLRAAFPKVEGWHLVQT
jgi:phosphatidylinositol glycan class U